MLESQEQRQAALLIGIEDTIRLLEVAAKAESDATRKVHLQVLSQASSAVGIHSNSLHP